MTIPKTIGLPRMQVETGEKRVFLPNFVAYLTELGLHVYLEEGYGSRLGFDFDGYRRGSEYIHRCSRDETFSQDLVLILRAPKMKEYPKLSTGSTLISMLHFPTRPGRVELLTQLKIRAISLDSIVDDYNLRRVENMRAVSWNGLETGFDLLAENYPDLRKPDGKPFHVLVLGTGMVGKDAVEAGTKLGNLERYHDYLSQGGPGAISISIGRSVSDKPELMKSLMHSADVLVDATQRRNASLPVVPNDWINWLPEHAVIVDLAVDPYLPDHDPPVVRGIEGIPQGNLDQYIFYPDDQNWCATIPEGVQTQFRRRTVTCYSWPGIHPEACMEHYAHQLSPFLKVLAEKGYDQLSLEGEFFERALYRGTIKYFLESTI